MSGFIWTIGHSTRTIEEFLTLFRSHDIEVVVDVRRFPYSQRSPQFQKDRLAESLRDAGRKYVWMPILGGRRPTRPDSINRGWRSAGFRGYADYMQTVSFGTGLETLMNLASKSTVAVMCAEAVPWKCHRLLIADALVSREWTVRHIVSPARAESHRLTSFAQENDSYLIYPTPAFVDFSNDLFSTSPAKILP